MEFDPRFAIGSDRRLRGGPPPPRLLLCRRLQLGRAGLVAVQPLELVLHSHTVLLLELDEPVGAS